jgi:predicted aspartyl protease
MNFAFNPTDGPVIVLAQLWGKQGDLAVQLALDTGATASVLSWETVALLGYDPAATEARVQITTGSGVEFAPRVSIDKIEALGKERLNFPVLCHTLPPSAGVDGLLGLDFLRGYRLVLDFRTGTLSIE